MSDTFRPISQAYVRFIDPNRSDPYNKTRLRLLPSNLLRMQGPAKTTLSGTVKTSSGTGVKRALKVFIGSAFLEQIAALSSNTDGTFSIEVNGNDNDEFTVIAVGNQGEDHAVVSRVKGEAT